MSDRSSQGKNWTSWEIELIVSDYFDMREKFLRGEAFVKTRHYQPIMQATGRTKGSVEAKYMNISATLERLSLPWLEGYAPLRNFQGALLSEVEKFVAREWNEDVGPSPSASVEQNREPLRLDEAPNISGAMTSNNTELERIARKFDAVDSFPKLGHFGRRSR